MEQIQNDEKWENYEKCLKPFSLPAAMAGDWEVLKCLKDGEDSWTILVRERVSGIVLVLKWGRGLKGRLLIQEESALRELNGRETAGVPRAYRLFEEKDSVYFLREYIRGTSLFELAENGTGLRGAEIKKEGFSADVSVSDTGTGRRTTGFTEWEIRKVGVEICRIVREMHSLPVPMVHRDIKPENVVVSPEGRIFLVDFGTVRLVKTGRDSDTLCLGSRGTAAPEQYGCMQTDRRTDIYAVGRTLLYLAVSSYDENQLADSGLSRGFQRVIRKACAFEPDRRYRNMEELEKAISACSEKRGLRAACVCAVVVMAAVVGGLGWMHRAGAANGYAEEEETRTANAETQTAEEEARTANAETQTAEEETRTANAEAQTAEEETRTANAETQTTDVETLTGNETESAAEETGLIVKETAAASESGIVQMDGTEDLAEEGAAETAAKAVDFQEPMIEEAVRRQLGLDDETPVTEEMLDEVHSIRIVGKEILEAEDVFVDSGNAVQGKEDSFGQERGTVSDLSDLKKMKNLEEVALSNQMIEDITPLAGLNIRTLYLTDNMISDFSVLTELPELEELCIASNPAEDVSCLGKCENLKELNLIGLRITDLEFIRDLSLTRLYLADCLTEEETDYGFLLTQTSLTDLCISEINESKAQAVSQMKWLNVLNLWGMSEIEDLTVFQDLDKLYSLRLSPGFRSLQGIGEMRSLATLCIEGCTELTDLAELPQAKFVSYLDIRNCEITDYSVITRLSRLETLLCTQEQQESVLALEASPEFEIVCG